MDYARRVALLRFTALIAIAVSAVLTVDHISPGRDFCPLAEACAAARESALGSIGGVPTSVIGMAAFGALILLTLLPLEWARPLLKPAGAVAALAGLGFIAYQRLVLTSFCPLCLIADGAGFLAGILTLTWPQLPMRRSGRCIRWEGGSSRVAWTMAALLAAVVPFAIPRAEDPGWVEITPMAESMFDEQAPAETAAAAEHGAPGPVVVLGPDPSPFPAPAPHAAPARAAPDAQAMITPLDLPPTKDDPPSATEPPEVPAAAPPVVDAPAKVKKPRARPAPRRPKAPVKRRVATRPKSPMLVEYLNAFCGHCRATHKRLHAVLAETGVEVRRRRVYTWAGKSIPEWARACAYAERFGLEDRMFAELLKAHRPSRREITAAARRAGLDIQGLITCLEQRNVPARLARDKRLVQQSRIRKLPTIDIGRRRLMGSQSSSELRTAVLAAAGS